VLLLVGTSAGCGHFYDSFDSCLVRLHCEHDAKLAWVDARELYCDVAHPYNFGEGFRAGYLAVCLGNADGCAPPYPPRRYWSIHYQNPEGKAKTMAWYDGYAHGVLAAQCGGCAGRCHILTAQDLYGSGPCSGADEVDYAIDPEQFAPAYQNPPIPISPPPAPAAPVPPGDYGPTYGPYEVDLSEPHPSLPAAQTLELPVY
jgi:hypothetical protein